MISVISLLLAPYSRSRKKATTFAKEGLAYWLKLRAQVISLSRYIEPLYLHCYSKKSLPWILARVSNRFIANSRHQSRSNTSVVVVTEVLSSHNIPSCPPQSVARAALVVVILISVAASVPAVSISSISSRCSGGSDGSSGGRFSGCRP